VRDGRRHAAHGRHGSRTVGLLLFDDGGGIFWHDLGHGPGDEFRHVAARLQNQFQRVVASFGRVIGFQLPAQAVRFDPHDRVALGVKLGGPPKEIDGDVVLLQASGGASQIPLPNVAHQAVDAGRGTKSPRGEDRINLRLVEPCGMSAFIHQIRPLDPVISAPAGVTCLKLKNLRVGSKYG
jgi:hypothetical protein